MQVPPPRATRAPGYTARIARRVSNQETVHEMERASRKVARPLVLAVRGSHLPRYRLKTRMFLNVSVA